MRAWRGVAAHALGLAVVSWTVLAAAHAFLERAEPRVGSTVHQAPTEVRLWFTEQLEPAFSTAEVRNPAGQVVSTARASVDASDRKQLRVPVSSLTPGSYKVSWRVLSVDTHVTEGDFTFRVAP
jgi:methionine-rich copper-binding protein CopC